MSDHRTDYLRNWDLFQADLEFMDLVKKGKQDRFRVYQDHQNFEVWGKREGRITALPTEEDAVKRLEALTEAHQINAEDENNSN